MHTQGSTNKNGELLKILLVVRKAAFYTKWTS